MFRIHYTLKKPQEIIPWGEAQKSLHWFGLTDSLLWIEAGDSVIYEYAEAYEDQNGHLVKYNDYQLSRFLEDFSGIMSAVSESVPEYLYQSIDSFEKNLQTWISARDGKSDEEFDWFYDNQFLPLNEWFYERTIDSGHLVDGPLIGFFRCGDRLKLFWHDNYLTSKEMSIWRHPKGAYEMKYSDFVSEVSRFFKSFFQDMDDQVANVLENGIPGVYVDNEALAKENETRKEEFSYQVGMLSLSDYSHTDWDKIKELHETMMSEIN